MVTARDLISIYLDEKKPGAVVKGETLSGSDVAALKPKQGILVDGRRAVVIDVEKSGSDVTLIYSKGVRKTGRDKIITVSVSDKETPVQYYSRKPLEAAEHLIEKLTRGMRNAYSRQENVKRCPECGLSVPRYPGKYPKACPDCGAELECVSKEY